MHCKSFQKIILFLQSNSTPVEVTKPAVNEEGDSAISKLEQEIQVTIFCIQYSFFHFFLNFFSIQLFLFRKEHTRGTITKRNWKKPREN